MQPTKQTLFQTLTYTMDIQYLYVLFTTIYIHTIYNILGYIRSVHFFGYCDFSMTLKGSFSFL